MDFRKAPLTSTSVLTSNQLVDKFTPLLGSQFILTHKVKTDGSTMRKVITSLLDDTKENAEEKDYIIVPPKKKGVPRLLAETIDTYLVTSGDSYNLQVWNRIPNSNVPLVRYADGNTITCKDIRLVLVKVENNIVESIIITTPQYLEDKFGPFGKPTIKYQLLVSDKERANIVNGDKIYFCADSKDIQAISNKKYLKPSSPAQSFNVRDILSLDIIKEKVADRLLGTFLGDGDTKTRGQMLERKVLNLLGYGAESKLVGGYPDVPNQLMEVKVQDSQTIDLGLYSPQFKEKCGYASFTTYDMRYLIALTNPKSHKIEGVILSCGELLGNRFTYVSDVSYKCQRSIPMAFFDKHKNSCVFNPKD